MAVSGPSNVLAGAEPSPALAQASLARSPVNPGFESGDLAGWTVVSGTAFSDASVIDAADWGREGSSITRGGTTCGASGPGAMARPVSCAPPPSRSGATARCRCASAAGTIPTACTSRSCARRTARSFSDDGPRGRRTRSGIGDRDAGVEPRVRRHLVAGWHGPALTLAAHVCSRLSAAVALEQQVRLSVGGVAERERVAECVDDRARLGLLERLVHRAFRLSDDPVVPEAGEPDAVVGVDPAGCGARTAGVSRSGVDPSMSSRRCSTAHRRIS